MNTDAKVPNARPQVDPGAVRLIVQTRLPSGTMLRYTGDVDGAFKAMRDYLELGCYEFVVVAVP